jgi:hypothetical protein
MKGQISQEDQRGRYKQQAASSAYLNQLQKPTVFEKLEKPFGFLRLKQGLDTRQVFEFDRDTTRCLAKALKVYLPPRSKQRDVQTHAKENTRKGMTNN